MSRTLREALNESNPNKLAAACQEVPLGNALGLSLRSVVGALVGTVLPLPEGARAQMVAGAGVNRTGAAAVTPTITDVGNLNFAGGATGNVVEAHYFAREGVVKEVDLQVVSNTLTLPTGSVAGQILSAEATAGTSAGTKAVIARGGTVAAGQAALSFAGNTVVFFGTDAVTHAKVKYVEQPRATVADSLEGETNV